MAMTISIPLFVFVFLLTDTFLGLAKATNKQVIAINRNKYKKGFSLEVKEAFALNPFTLGMVKIAMSFFRVKKCHIAKRGTPTKSHKKPGFKNSKLVHIFRYCF